MPLWLCCQRGSRRRCLLRAAFQRGSAVRTRSLLPANAARPGLRQAPNTAAVVQAAADGHRWCAQRRLMRRQPSETQPNGGQGQPRPLGMTHRTPLLIRAVALIVSLRMQRPSHAAAPCCAYSSSKLARPCSSTAHRLRMNDPVLFLPALADVS